MVTTHTSPELVKPGCIMQDIACKASLPAAEHSVEWLSSLWLLDLLS